MKIQTGLDILIKDKAAQRLCEGNLAYLCHNASFTSDGVCGIEALQHVFGQRLLALFGPQHGIFADAQANMIETESSIHPYFKLPAYSLYGETRIPTEGMLKGISTIIVDLQDIGARIYTYIHTLSLLMKACAEFGVRVVVLDRPNPIGGNEIEGNVLDPQFSSFVGLHSIPMRHGMTIGEMGKFLKNTFYEKTDLHIILMKDWSRSMYFDATGLPFIPPSPNIPTVQSTIVYPGTVLLEGTSISEGRGTTKPFEILGIPDLDAFAFSKHFQDVLDRSELSGCWIRPNYFTPTFDKHRGVSCGGFEIFVTDRSVFRPWRFAQVFLRELYHYSDSSFSWNPPPYEYEEKHLPIDILNGTSSLREWVEANGSLDDLVDIEKQNMREFLELRNACLCAEYS